MTPAPASPGGPIRRWPPLLIGLLLTVTACRPTLPPSHTVTLVRQPEAVAWTRPLDHRPLRQTITVPEGGLSEIELVLALPDDAPALPSRPLDWEIRDSGLALERQGLVETAGYLHNSPVRLRFEPLAGGQVVELRLTAPPAARLSLWTSDSDRYPSGSLLENEPERNVDLHFTLRATETPAHLLPALRESARRWQEAALWLPLLLVAPGWLLGWLLAPRDGRPLVPAAAGLSLALAPLIYLWARLADVRLYAPLVQSLFQAAALALLLLMLRDLDRVAAGWRSAWRGALAALAAAIVLSAATWLLAGRAFPTAPGELAMQSGLLARELAETGLAGDVAPTLPIAALTATLTQMSHQNLTRLLLLATLILGVATLPSLYALAAEVALAPWAALWLVPLAWLWPTPWQALARGDLLVLYSLVLLPVTVALGWRALRSTARGGPAVALAAVPLAALTLVQGWAVLLAWGLTLAFALLDRPRWPPTAVAPLDPPRRQRLLRGALWLAGAALLLLPAWWAGLGLSPLVNPAHAGYDWLVLIVLLAVLAGGLARGVGGAGQRAVTTLVLLSLPLLFWWRSAPLDPPPTAPTDADVELLQWARTGTPDAALFLLNLDVSGDRPQAIDGGLWLPFYGGRDTVLQYPLPRDLLARAMQPGALQDEAVRQALQQAGVSHVYLGAAPGPLKPHDLLDQPWSRLARQSGSSYVFELLPPVPTRDRE